jgi:predicted nucleotidyltransferase
LLTSAGGITSGHPLFGSVLTERFRPESDVDVLIEFEPEDTPGLFALARMQFEIEAVVGRSVDLRPPKVLSRYFRDEVLDRPTCSIGRVTICVSEFLVAAG